MLSLRRGDRRGFTLVELIVVLVVMAALAAVITPAVIGRLGQGEAGAMSQNLRSVATAVERFRTDVGRYPDSLQHLVALPATARDVCGNVLPAAFRAEWSGPYLTRAITPAGIRTGTSLILRDVTRSPALSSISTPTGTLVVQATGVDQTLAQELDVAFDGTTSLSSGTIRWSSATGGTLFYDIPIRGC